MHVLTFGARLLADPPGYPPRSGSSTSTGVFAAAGIDGYMHHHLDGGPLKDPTQPGLIFLGEVGSEKDYIATRVSYALDVTGPSMNINSACSSGLVAVARAMQAIVLGDCDVAIAGASSISFPNLGYMYGEGLVGSVDGSVRPLDEAASGTVFGDAVGAVVLKPLEDAIEDGDHIWATLLGEAVTNDGRQKASYSAPSATAQAAAITTALSRARVDPTEVSYVECHATATLMGDGIEMRGLRMGFKNAAAMRSTNEKMKAAERPTQNTPASALHGDAENSTPAESDDGNLPSSPWCALGSIKGNIGHANCAAGITGLIKTILCLYHKALVPTVHFQKANPKLRMDTDSSPFFIQPTGAPWDGIAPSKSTTGRRVAGVSSFGIGGTNCHIVLEEYVNQVPATTSNAESDSPQPCVLPISAKTNAALRRNCAALSRYLLEGKSSIALPRVAHTLQIGREHFECRTCVIATSSLDASSKLAAVAAPGSDLPDASPPKSPGVIFMFPGQGSQYLGMAEGLYSRGPASFRREFDKCSEILLPLLGGQDIRSGIFADPTARSMSAFNSALMTQPAIFVVEYALGVTLMELGLRPIALAGHSIGEYVAATIAGILSLEDALTIVTIRARATEHDCAPGAMLSVRMPESDVRGFVTEFNERGANGIAVSLAAVNSPVHHVLSGSRESLDAAAAALEERGVRAKFLHVSHGFHSGLMLPAAHKIKEYMDSATADIEAPPAPKIPMTSNVTGRWVSDELASSEYWANHMTGTVRWLDNVQSLLRWDPDLLIEVGPGSTLSTLTSKTIALQPPSPDSGEGRSVPLVLSSMRHPTANDVDDVSVLYDLLAAAWKTGVAVKWPKPQNALNTIIDPLVPSYQWEQSSHWSHPGRSIYVNDDSSSTVATAAALKSSAPDSPLLVRFNQSHGAVPRVILYCFPYAGGSSSVFKDWAMAASLLPWLEVVAIEPHGRGGRSDDPSRDASHAADATETAALIAAIERDSDRFEIIAFCGLSMGSLVAVEVLAGLKPGIAAKVQFVCLAGRCPPAVDDESVEDWDAALEALVLAPKDVMESSAWESLYERHIKPKLISDLQADARAASRVAQLLVGPESERPVKCPLTVFGGTEDLSFPVEAAERWRNLMSTDTASRFSVTHFDGAHNFLVEKSPSIFSELLIALKEIPGLEFSMQPPKVNETSRPILHSVNWTVLKEKVLESSDTYMVHTLDVEVLREPEDSGIGVVLGMEKTSTAQLSIPVIEVDGLSAAEKAGLQRGDEVLAVNNVSVDGRLFSDITNQIAGSSSSVVLSISRSLVEPENLIVVRLPSTSLATQKAGVEFPISVS